MTRRFLVAACLVASSACGGEGGSPTGPSSSPSETRIIFLEGNMNFGDVALGSNTTRTLRIFNQGNNPLTITNMTGPGGYAASWTSGTIAPSNGSQEITFRFTPTENRTYNGNLTVNGNQTSGTNTIAFSGRGLRELYTRSGVGNTVFDMPTDISRVRITGSTTERCQNFIMHIGGRHVVNEILGTGCSAFVGSLGPTYSGEHLVSGGVVEITSSNGISWSITELR